jgi:hypothetical protein
VVLGAAPVQRGSFRCSASSHGPETSAVFVRFVVTPFVVTPSVVVVAVVVRAVVALSSDPPPPGPLEPSATPESASATAATVAINLVIFGTPFIDAANVGARTQRAGRRAFGVAQGLVKGRFDPAVCR